MVETTFQLEKKQTLNIALWIVQSLLAVMFFITIFHISKGEIQSIGITIVLGFILAFIAWGRFKKVQIHSIKD